MDKYYIIIIFVFVTLFLIAFCYIAELYNKICILQNQLIAIEKKINTEKLNTIELLEKEQMIYIEDLNRKVEMYKQLTINTANILYNFDKKTYEKLRKKMGYTNIVDMLEEIGK